MFEEKAGTNFIQEDGFRWAQSAKEVQVEVKVPEGTRGKDLEVKIGPTELRVGLRGGGGPRWVEGTLGARANASESLWTLEDGVVRVVLEKAVEYELWPSLLQGTSVSPFHLESMQKRMLLEKFQKQHPGFDFSGAEVSGQAPSDIASFMEPEHS